MKSIARVVLVVAVILSGYAAVCQVPAAPNPGPQVVTPKAPYDSTKAQLLVTKEENLQLKANAAQTEFQAKMKEFQSQWQAEEAALTEWIAEVKKVNGWDDSYSYDREKNQWVHAPKAKAAETPKK